MPTTLFKETKTASELAEIHVASLTAQIEGHKDAIDTIVRKWKPLVHSMVGELKTENEFLALQQLETLSIELRKQLNSLGYFDLAKQIVTGYPKSAQYALKYTTATLGQQFQAKMPTGILKTVQEMDLSVYESIGTKGIAELTKQLVLDVAVGVPRKKMLEAVDRVMDKSFAEPANLYVDTATRQMDRQVTMAVWKEAGLDTFKYFGPKDNKNRDFCSERVGKVYTLKEIEAMDNGQGLPVLQFGGGWRCRHTFQPVQGEDKKRPSRRASKQMNLGDV